VNDSALTAMSEIASNKNNNTYTTTKTLLTYARQRDVH
jgi:hypothetical protein